MGVSAGLPAFSSGPGQAWEKLEAWAFSLERLRCPLELPGRHCPGGKQRSGAEPGGGAGVEVEAEAGAALSLQRLTQDDVSQWPSHSGRAQAARC